MVQWIGLKECAMEASTVCGELYQKEQDAAIFKGRVVGVVYQQMNDPCPGSC